MGKIPDSLRAVVSANIRYLRQKHYPGRGGQKKCCEAFKVSPQQWSPWETGLRVPDEIRLKELADFFGVTVEYIRTDHSLEQNITTKSIPKLTRSADTTKNEFLRLLDITSGLIGSGYKITISFEPQ